MQKLFKITLITIVTLVFSACVLVYAALRASLPQLDNQLESSNILATTSLSRDALGHAVINADNRLDAAYALGIAHAQDRLFQMDTQRRAASGSLSELLGTLTLEIDKRARFYQFEQRASKAFSSLPQWQRALLESYTAGVNHAAKQYSVLPIEYLLTRSKFAPWQPSDSLLVAYSMYMDLQVGQVNRDLALTRIEHHFGSQAGETCRPK